jgi:hypothetical protein
MLQPRHGFGGWDYHSAQEIWLAPAEPDVAAMPQ